MAIIETPNPRGTRLKAAAVGLLTGCWLGVSLACFVVGLIIARWQVVVAGVGLCLAMVTVSAIAGRLQRARNPQPAARLALAVIESRRAVGGETGDIPVQFELTVAPDERPAYRVKMRQHINLADIADYRVRGVVVVEYRPDEPWEVTIVTAPTEQWARRAATESVDSAPPSPTVAGPEEGVSFCLLATLGLLLGAGVVVLMFRAELADHMGSSETTSSSTSTSSTSTSTSSSGSGSTTTTTTTGGGGPSIVSGTATSDAMLSEGEIRRLADSLTTAMRTGSAVEFGIDERTMSMHGVLGVPADPDAVINVGALPYPKLPGLVREAQSKLGIANPTSWRIDVEAKAGVVAIRVTVADGQGAKASLEADAQGRVTRRNPR
ncbi:hypothetical protein [Embleya sp. AB8]|uniref:hypothetical protein n=1 Tax=Embleya sp. AB8 TaxID=3156304 RepID=UPI003C70F532